MSHVFNEDAYEQVLVSLFQNMGYRHVCGYDIERDQKIPLYLDELRPALRRLNPTLSQDILDVAEQKLLELPRGSLEDCNEIALGYLQNGLEVSYYHNGEQRTELVRLMDYETVENNAFVCANQWTVIEKETCRPDIVLFVNGFPVVLLELKSPSRSQTDASEGYLQIQRYKRAIPSFFYYNQICAISDMAVSKAGTITANESRFMEWKTVDGNYESTKYADYTTFFEGIFAQHRLLDIIHNFICYSVEGLEKYKILAAYHQYFAVKKAVESTVNGTKTDGKGGVFWHTQGSGKSLSMVFYVHLLRRSIANVTIVVITDRNDLDNQLYTQFLKCKSFLRQEALQAESQEHLKSLLDGRVANGIFFSTMGKFLDPNKPFTERNNIVVMADEAHRSQYGLVEKIKMVQKEAGKQEAHIIIGAARKIRNSLPNATYIGFTGTPVSQKDRNTIEVFGDYIDVYDMTQAVEDGATRPVYYESRIVNLKLDANILQKIDAEYEVIAADADPTALEKSKHMLGSLDAVLSNDTTVTSLVDDILLHYESTREQYLTGKALIVAYDRKCAMKIYQKILERHPDWTEKVRVVMTEGNKDPQEWHAIIGNKAYRDALGKIFKDEKSPFKIAIVVDMWLTGFDVPSLATMYMYKPMSGHNLMQAIARVNRVFADKEGGLIVDYIGIAAALKQAMSEYTKRDQKRYGDPDIRKLAYPKFQEKLSVCKDLLCGYDYSAFFSGEKQHMAEAILGTVNYLMAPDKEEPRTNFLTQAAVLKNALSLCASLATEDERYQASFMETVRVMLARLVNPGRGSLSLPEINKRINDLLAQSVKSEGVINLFEDTGETYSLFNPAFIEEVSHMQHKNLAVEILKRLLKEQIKVYRKNNVVQSQKFSEIMQKALNAYLNGMLTNQQVIDELLQMAEEMQRVQEEGNSLNLSAEEKAFYDALTQPEAIKDLYSNEALIALTRELTDTLRKNRTVDWHLKESARAEMRNIVRRLLRKYKYPPEGAKEAMNTVLQQCELWADTHYPATS